MSYAINFNKIQITNKVLLGKLKTYDVTLLANLLTSFVTFIERSKFYNNKKLKSKIIILTHP